MLSAPDRVARISKFVQQALQFLNRHGRQLASADTAVMDPVLHLLTAGSHSAVLIVCGVVLFRALRKVWRYPYEIRETKEYFEDMPDVKVAPDMLKLADHILKSKATDFDPSQFVDHYEQAVVEMLKKKQAGIAVSRGRTAPAKQNVVNLMDTLRRSLAQEKAASAPRKKARKRIEGQRELLLPIEGKKSKEPATKLLERSGTSQKKTG